MVDSGTLPEGDSGGGDQPQEASTVFPSRRVVSYKDICLGVNGGNESEEEDVPPEGWM